MKLSPNPWTLGRCQEFIERGAKHFLLLKGRLSNRRPLKTIDFTDPGGLSPQAPPLEYAICP